MVAGALDSDWTGTLVGPAAGSWVAGPANVSLGTIGTIGTIASGLISARLSPASVLTGGLLLEDSGAGVLGSCVTGTTGDASWTVVGSTGAASGSLDGLLSVAAADWLLVDSEAGTTGCARAGASVSGALDSVWTGAAAAGVLISGAALGS